MAGQAIQEVRHGEDRHAVDRLRHREYVRRPDEGRDLYRRAILILLQSDLDEAVTIFKEYFDKYYVANMQYIYTCIVTFM